jgi:hypothetical protein
MIEYQHKHFTNFARLTQYIADQHAFSDDLGTVYTNYSDLIPEMVILQQETIELLRVDKEVSMAALVKSLKKDLFVQVGYVSIYGQAWLITYPTVAQK